MEELPVLLRQAYSLMSDITKSSDMAPKLELLDKNHAMSKSKAKDLTKNLHSIINILDLKLQNHLDSALKEKKDILEKHSIEITQVIGYISQLCIMAERALKEKTMPSFGPPLKERLKKSLEECKQIKLIDFDAFTSLDLEFNLSKLMEQFVIKVVSTSKWEEEKQVLYSVSLRDLAAQDVEARACLESPDDASKSNLAFGVSYNPSNKSTTMQHIKSEDSAAKGNWSNNCKSDSLDNLDLLLSGIEIKEEPFSPKEQCRDACRVSQVVHDIPANFQQPLHNIAIKQDTPSKTLNNMKTPTQIVSEKVKISYSDLKKEKETPNLCPVNTLEKCRTQTLATLKTSHWSSKDIEPLRITFDLGPLIFTSKFGLLEIRAQLVSKIFGSKLFDHPTGLTVTEDGLLIVADTGSNVVKVLQDSSILFTIGEKDGVIFARPSAVVVDNQGHIYVKDDYCIQVFDIRGRLLHCIGRNTFLHPYGLALIKEGEDPTLVVIDAGRGGSIVHHYLIKKNKLITYPYKPLLRFGSKTSKVRFMAISGDIMLASDLGASQMYLSRTNGECLTTFSNYGTRPGEINEPSGIAVDAAGNWIVGDSKNNRIQVFTLDGSFIGPVRLSHPIRRPSGLHLTSDGHLYVINYLDNEIAVFKLLK